MGFERFVPPKSAGARPKATIRPSGLISFDAVSVETFNLEKASYGILFFDKNKKIIGFKPTAKADENGALKLSRRRRSVSVKSPQFFEQFGLKFDEPQKFDVDHDPEEGMLTIDVKNVQRRRGRRPKSAR